VLERVEAPVRPQGVLPLLEAERLAAAAVGREPRLEDGRLGVDDEPVEVEDDRGDPVGQKTRPSAPRRRRLRRAGRNPQLGVVVVGRLFQHGGYHRRREIP